jgi:hypothetical protein
MARAKNSKDVVQPSIRFGEEKHILETLFDGKQENMPEIKSIGYKRLDDKPNSWISYVITTKGREVVSIEVEEPNLRGIAEESAKIAFVNCFVDSEL